MKILKEGKRPEEKVYRHTCTNCKTLFEFLAKEGKTIYDQRDGNFITINCPLCIKECYIDL